MAPAVDSADADRLARDWMGKFLRWAAADRRRHGDAIDWEQGAIDGLLAAINGWRPDDGQRTFSLAYARRCYTGASSVVAARSRIARWRANFPPRAEFEPDLTPGRECDPATHATIRELAAAAAP